MDSKRILELRHEVGELYRLLAVLRQGELIKPFHDGKARIELKQILVLGLRGLRIRLSTETLVALHLERAQALASADAAGVACACSPRRGCRHARQQKQRHAT